MEGNYLKGILEKVFSEEIYEIREDKWNKYGHDMERFYICRYNERLDGYFAMITIETWILGCAPMPGKWEMLWTLPGQNYYMLVHEEDPFSFLSISKEKLETCVRINQMKEQLMADMKVMDTEPTRLVRDYKICLLERNNSYSPE